MARNVILLFLPAISLSGFCFAGASNFGTTGLIDIPSAHMAEDATLTTTVSSSDRYDNFALTYQALPWLEATFRYRRVRDAENIENQGWSDYYDRNFAAKIRLLEEDYYMPQVSIGMRDFVGTGLVGSEYLVASKNIGNFDVTLGVGWGDMAGDDDLKNPLIYLSDKFEDREDGANGGSRPGRIPLGSLFQGENIGLFGGVSYQFDRYPVRLLLERNPEYNRYDVDRFGVEKPETELSYGAEWDVTPNLTVGIGRQQGFDWSMRLAYQANTARRTPIRPVKYRNFDLLHTNIEEKTWYPAMLADMEQSGLLLLSGKLDEGEGVAYLRIGNQSYPEWSDAVDRATSLSDLYLPDNIRTIEFTLEDRGYEVVNMEVKRPTPFIVEEDLEVHQLQPEWKSATAINDADYETNFVQNKIAFDLGLTTRIQLFDPEEPFRYGIGIAANTTIPLPDNYLIRGSYTHMLDQNFDESIRDSNSVLPHVRTDVVDYLKDKNRLNALYLEKRGTIHPSTYWRGFGGILEEMYSGAGGEVLYHPYNWRVGFGASMAWVKQREPDDDFAMRDYETVTGFVSAYWDTPFYNYDVALHVGKYLAKDTGATFEIRRTFSNGWSVGAWATFTDVSSEDFGEGSFDKGIFIKIPLDGIYERGTRSTFSTSVRPIQRDGGQRLGEFSNSIWNDSASLKYSTNPLGN